MSGNFLFFANLAGLLLAGYSLYLIVRVRLYITYGVAWLLLIGFGLLSLNFPPLWTLLRWIAGTDDAQQAWMVVVLGGVIFLLIYLFVQLTILSERITDIARHIALGEITGISPDEKASVERGQENPKKQA